MGRTTSARSALVAAMAAILMVVALPTSAQAAEPTFTPVKRHDVVRKLVFPIVGVSQYWSGFGACRDNCTREHHGIDIMTYGWKGLPVVAAHAGTISKVTYNEGNAGCSVRIRSRARWETRYLHLNNDAPGTDEISHPCPAPGIEVGAKVEAGQLIGWVGDSGNSENTSPHLHFELRNRSGYPIDPYRSLRNSSKVVFEWLSPDASEASITLSKANQPDGAAITFVASLADAPKLEQSEVGPSVLQAPVIIIDPANPQPALDEIARLNSGRVVIFADDNPSVLTNHLMSGARMVETAALPVTPSPTVLAVPDATEAPTFEPNTPDRFATIISGRVDRIWRSRQDEYLDFISSHRSLVLTDAHWASTNLGEKSWTSPGKHADAELLWWHTGTGWIGTDSLGDVPERGFAYLTERRATPWTLAYLGSLTEAPPLPVWRGDQYR